ncbi:MAG TPA: BlaI/MecI/CopY family transcriptional regulator [Clostridia bacterium]|nr:BlaI/MecI/CopY family transcriptional regulator [Clostridia bacterium]
MKENLNPNEWIVMNALWEKSPLTLGEAIAQIGSRASWGYKTYQSYMNVLEKKGFVLSQKRGRDKFYSPAVSREACVARESESLLAKLEGRSVKLLLASMVRESDLSEEDYAELKKLLDEQFGKEGT